MIHYCVANMPGRRSAHFDVALGAATAPYIAALANRGAGQAMAEDAGLAAGLNVANGRIVHPAVVASLPNLA